MIRSFEAQMTPQLEELVTQYDAAAREARTLVESLTREQLGRRPAPGRWSAADNLVHLSLTSQQWMPRLADAISGARRQGVVGDGPYRMDLVGRLLKWVLEPPSRVRVSTRAGFEPAGDAPVEQALPDFLRLQDRLLEHIRESSGLALDRVQVVSPFESRLRYNLYSSFHIIIAHQRRHFWQARKAAAVS